MVKSVCIIGAGPAGIVAAKTLLHEHPKGSFAVTVFEQSNRIGGLWPLSDGDGGLVNPLMHTNLSRHTVSFSDLSWPESSPSFPKAWQVGQYLNRYVKRYGGIDIRTSCKVVKATRAKVESIQSKRWKVEVEERKTANPPSSGSNLSVGEEVDGPKEAFYFDHLIIASGFFGKPNIPTELQKSKPSIPIVHSSQFRNIEELLKDVDAAQESHDRKIVVVGGSMSGAEVAASIANQLSSEINSPGVSRVENADKYKVHHVFKRPSWILPLYIPVNIFSAENDGRVSKDFNPAPKFLALDLAMYDMAKRPPGPITNRSGSISSESSRLANDYFQSVAGTDQSGSDSESSHGFAIQGDLRSEAPWLGISDSYAQFVQSGHVTTTIGELVGLDESQVSRSIIVSEKDQTVKVDNVAAIVLATGFKSSGSLQFLPDDLLQTLGYDPNCSAFPLLLNIHSTVNREVPDLGFVGFYRGPYWGVMEMQARYLGKLWIGDERALSALAEDKSPIPDLRRCHYETPKQLAQFPMGDYTYLMESFTDILGIARMGEGRAGPVLPSRYLDSHASDESRQESSLALSIVGKTINGSTNHGKFVARAIFTAMQGTWQLDRSLISSIATYPSGTFIGTAKFLPRRPTDPEFDAEYLYIEEGDFETEQGMKFRANRRYSHRYNESQDTLSVWFTKADNKTVDYLFHELEILPPQDGSGWRARAHHLCIADTYDVVYEFRFKGVRLDTWSLAYSVKGPSKDYRIESKYRR